MIKAIASALQWTYHSVAGGLLAFIFLNIAIGLAYFVKDRYFLEAFRPEFLQDIKVTARLHGVPLKPHYPDLSDEQIMKLLGETWMRAIEYEPNTGYREPPFSGEYVNISEHGFRFSGEQAPWPPQSGIPSVFFFGASTTFGYGLMDSQTVPSWFSVLARALPGWRQLQVYNFGRASYNSTLERILFEKLVVSGHIPTYAVFVDGYADSYFSSHTPRLTGQITRFVERINQGFFIEESASWNKILLHAVKKLPIYRALTSLKLRLLKGKGGSGDQQEKEGGNTSPNKPSRADGDQAARLSASAGVEAAISRYLANVRMTGAIAKEFNVTPFFIWQPTPFFNFDLNFHPFPGESYARERIGAVYPEMEKKRHEMPLSSTNFIWCADIQKDFHEYLYVDFAHYNSKAAKMAAGCILEGMRPLLAGNKAR